MKLELNELHSILQYNLYCNLQTGKLSVSTNRSYMKYIHRYSRRVTQYYFCYIVYYIKIIQKLMYIFVLVLWNLIKYYSFKEYYKDYKNLIITYKN